MINYNQTKELKRDPWLNLRIRKFKCGLKNNKTKQPKPFSQTHQIFQPSDSWNFISSSQMPQKPFTNYNRVMNFLGTIYPRLLRIEMDSALKKREKLRSSSREAFDTPFVVFSVFSKSFNLYRLSLWNSFVQARPTFFESCLVCLRHSSSFRRSELDILSFLL